MNPVDLKVKQSYYVQVILIGIFTLGIGALLIYIEHRRWAQVFDPAGVTRIDGKKFLWQDLQEKRRVNMRNRANAPLNHIELIFSGGKALVFPLMLENRCEVMAYLEQVTVKK
jgi:hypothetical protein